MQPFRDDDSGYRQWLAAHPEGFVLNTYTKPKPTYLVLHRTSCHTISGNPARGVRWTADYIKFCGGRRELEEYARRDLGGAVQPCGVCL